MSNTAISKKHPTFKGSKKTDILLFKRLFFYIRKRMGIIILILVTMLIGDILGVLPPYFLKKGLDESVSNNNLSDLYQNATYLTLALFGGFIFSVLFNYLSKYIGLWLTHDIRMDITKKIFKLNNRYFDKTPTGNILTYLTNDIEAIRQFISEGVVSIIGDLVQVIFILGMMIYINMQLAFFAIISVPLFIIATYLFRVSLRIGYQGIRKSSSIMNTILVEAINGIKEISLFNHIEKTIKDFEEGNKIYRNSFLKVVFAYSLYFPLIEMVSFVSMVAILFCAHLYIDIHVTTGEIFAFFFYINMFFRPLRHLAEQFNTFQAAMSGAERIFFFLDTPIDFNDQKATIFDYRAKGVIDFKNVTFSYDADKHGKGKKNNQVIKNVSFHIKQGEKIAIVGSTGSGKSTLISLLNNLYPLDRGEIKIDGINIKEFSFKNLRENITTIPQNIFLFTGSFYDNIALQKDVSMDEVKEVSKKVYLDGYISKRKKKYAESVLEEGKSISTGQKQLLSFARAFIKNAAIVVLDEATSNVDSESEARVQDALYEIIKGKTTIIIAHRLSTIKQVDRILVLHHGKLVEQGSHSQLMKVKHGFYRDFYRIQSMQLEHAIN